MEPSASESSADHHSATGILILTLLLLAVGASADDTLPDSSDPIPAPADTIAGSTDVADTLQPESRVLDTTLFRPGNLLVNTVPVTDTVDLEQHLKQNPTVALFKSMVIPGWGQMGNGKWMKAVVYFGLDLWFIGSVFHYDAQVKEGWREYEQAEDIGVRNQLYSLYEDRKDRRNKFSWFAVILTFVSMFDAYVDAHLSGFPSTDRTSGLSLDCEPAPSGGISATFSYSF